VEDLLKFCGLSADTCKIYEGRTESHEQQFVVK